MVVHARKIIIDQETNLGTWSDVTVISFLYVCLKAGAYLHNMVDDGLQHWFYYCHGILFLYLLTWVLLFTIIIYVIPYLLYMGFGFVSWSRNLCVFRFGCFFSVLAVFFLGGFFAQHWCTRCCGFSFFFGFC